MAEPTLRLFFALWPDPATRAVIGAVAQDVAAEAGGRAVNASNIHLTLAFLGDQPATSLPMLRALAAAVELVPFQLALDDIGCFRKSGVAWLGASMTPSGLASLRDRLAHALGDSGIALDTRPFAPHLTLARHITVAVGRRLAQPILWAAASFALVSSKTLPEGARYRVLEVWRARA